MSVPAYGRYHEGKFDCNALDIFWFTCNSNMYITMFPLLTEDDELNQLNILSLLKNHHIVTKIYVYNQQSLIKCSRPSIFLI